MSARDDVRAEFSWTPYPEQEAEYERLLDAFRAEVLREAAALGRELSRQGYSAQEIANRLDRMAGNPEEARDGA